MMMLEEQFSWPHPHTIKSSRSTGPIIRIEGETYLPSTAVVEPGPSIIQWAAIETQVVVDISIETSSDVAPTNVVVAAETTTEQLTKHIVMMMRYRL